MSIILSDSEFSSNINTIIKDLSFYHRNRNDLINMYVQERLNKSLQEYYHSILKTFDYLNSRNDVNLLKKYKGVVDE